MLYDNRGRSLERVKRFGYLSGPPEYKPAEKPARVELVDAIATERVELEEDDEE